jgi:hypothetical protein
MTTFNLDGGHLIMNSVLLIACFVVMGLALILYKIFSPKGTSKFVHGLVYASLIFTLLCVVLYATRGSISTGPMRAFLDFRYSEFSHSATYSSLLLFIAGISALGISIFARQQPIWFRVYFVLLSLMMVFLATDEYFLIHETIPQWERYYVPVAVGVALLGMRVFWLSNFPHRLLIYVAFFGGLAGSVVGGVVLEEFRGDACLGMLAEACVDLPALEETLELLGYILSAAAFILLAQYLLDKDKLSQFFRLVSISSVAWLVFILFSFWVQPSIESRFFATPAEIRFTESHLAVKSYKLNQEAFRAGDTLALDLFWQVDAAESTPYGYSVNLLDPVTGESILRENFVIAYPAVTGWFPGITYRSRARIAIPDSIESPLSPILTVTIWHRSNESFNNFTYAESSLPIFAERYPILATLSFLSETEENLPQANYRFANGILLANPSLSEVENGNYMLELSWMAENDIHDNFGYFIHFLNEDGQNHLIFDRPPFGNHFLTSAWIQGMFERDSILLEIPEGTSGTFTPFMGFLNIATGERLAVQDSAGNEVPNGSIPLGASIVIGE